VNRRTPYLSSSQTPAIASTILGDGDRPADKLPARQPMRGAIGFLDAAR
jgi:hypothetical protein